MRGRVVATLVAGLVAAVVLVVGLLAFEPWRLVTDSTVEETLPVAQVEPAPVPTPAAADVEVAPEATSPTPAPPTLAPAPTGPVTLARGELVDAEHGTDGVARIVLLADRRRFVNLEGLDTSDGPDLSVLLSASPSGGEWGSYDDRHHVDLGSLKANHGTHHYEIPADADLTDIASVVIWCDRFDVAFGTAPVDPA